MRRKSSGWRTGEGDGETIDALPLLPSLVPEFKLLFSLVVGAASDIGGNMGGNRSAAELTLKTKRIVAGDTTNSVKPRIDHQA